MLTKIKIIIIFALLLGSMSAHSSPQNTLAFLQYDGDYWQVFVRQGTAEAKKVSTSRYDKSALSWLADGVTLFVCGIQGNAEIINTVKNESQLIQLPKNNINDAVMSPDGSKIVYSHIAKNSPNNKLWLFNRKNNTNTPLFPEMPGRQYDPKWSVKGDAVYFVTGVANTHYEINKLLLSKVSSKAEAQPVIVNTKYNLDIDISVTEKAVYSSNLKGGFDLWVKDGDSGRQLTFLDGSESRPSWSQDEKQVYFETMNEDVLNIWSVTYPEGELTQITTSKTGARHPVLFNKVEK